MGKLVYSYLTSLDGFVEDEDGNFDWAAPDMQVHAFINDLMQPVGTHLYGRRMYETMMAWETMDSVPDQPPAIVDFAQLWKAADKVVYSTTLEAVTTTRTRIERRFDPDAVRDLKAAVDHDVTIAGAELAAPAFAAGLIDECYLFIAPVLVGGGKRLFPDGVHADLELMDEHPFPGGMVYLHYRVRN